VQSAFSHAGQKCSAASLAIVERSVYEDPLFCAQLIDAVASLSVGASYDLSTQMGPIIRPPEAPLLRALTTLDDGESWLVEPRQLDVSAQRWSPGVKVGVRPGSWSHLNEWFGPVLGVMIAGSFEEAISWQNQTPYALTAGLHSLNEEECERWIENVDGGNLYLNRGTTGAIVHRQPFGGWKRSSVGPTAKAGGANYVNCLRQWATVSDREAALGEAREWWENRGSRARDDIHLSAERNVVRYRHTLKPIAIRVDNALTTEQLAYLRGLVELANLDVEFSADALIKGLVDVTLESVPELAGRAGGYAKVRWLSRESPPTSALLSVGVSLDPRPLAQDGAVELVRWLLEQSVAITNHRYGNTRAGPKPTCRGLGDEPHRASR
jgi:RHH-type proline utilization regulon transcriptional repressor/proline dehydrogenase/delta 1-pyrroline-5-carboxylate dehydrogenase